MSTIDFTVSGGGSVYLLQPLTEAARDWCAEHIPADAQTWGGAIAVEHRYIGPLVDGIAGDGLTVEAA
jgi:hypothetical protein